MARYVEKVIVSSSCSLSFHSGHTELILCAYVLIHSSLSPHVAYLISTSFSCCVALESPRLKMKLSHHPPQRHHHRSLHLLRGSRDNSRSQMGFFAPSAAFFVSMNKSVCHAVYLLYDLGQSFFVRLI